jgi:hypothetical protein
MRIWREIFYIVEFWVMREVREEANLEIQHHLLLPAETMAKELFD